MDERQCRICFDANGTLVTPCRCRGTQAYIHPECLRVYFAYYPDGVCRVCRNPMKRLNPDELQYGVAGLFWILALAYASELPPDHRFVYLTLVSGFLTYCFAVQSMPVLFGLCAMGFSGALLVSPYDTSFQLLLIAVISFTVSVLCMYIPLQFLMLMIALLLLSLYSTIVIFYALSRATPLSASILSCFLIFLWYLAIRARPPQRIV